MFYTGEMNNLKKEKKRKEMGKQKHVMTLSLSLSIV